jgi:hypothetical protein
MLQRMKQPRIDILDLAFGAYFVCAAVMLLTH